MIDFSIITTTVTATNRELKGYYSFPFKEIIDAKYIRDKADLYKEAAKELYKVADYMDLNHIKL